MGDVTRFRNYPQMATVKKAAETFGVSPSYLRRLCKAGRSSLSIPVMFGLSIWIALPGTLTKATRARRKPLRMWEKSAGWRLMGRIGGIVLANKRMFSVDVTETDAFLEMPLTAQALYFHLGMRGDDDGFVSNPRSIVRVSGCSESDLVTLAKSGYIITFRSGVIVISDWKVNNNLRNDRYKPTTFQDERSMLSETANKRYILNGGNQVDTNGIPSDNQMTPT